MHSGTHTSTHRTVSKSAASGSACVNREQHSSSLRWTQTTSSVVLSLKHPLHLVVTMLSSCPSPPPFCWHSAIISVYPPVAVTFVAFVAPQPCSSYSFLFSPRLFAEFIQTHLACLLIYLLTVLPYHCPLSAFKTVVGRAHLIHFSF